MWLNIFKKWKKDSWNNIYTKLGNPGIAIYVKKKYYSDTLIFLEQSNQFHDLSRTNGFIEIGYKKIEYKSEITHCDFQKSCYAILTQLF